MTSPSLTQDLSAFAAAVDFGSRSAEEQQALKGLVLDSLACAYAARRSAVCQQVEAVAHITSALPGSPCTVIGSSVLLGPEAAAFVNGALIHALNYDALGSRRGHIGAVGLPAPLAAAELIGGVSGARLLDGVAAAVLTSEILASFGYGRLAGRSTEGRWLFGQVVGYFGAAAGASRVLGLGASDVHSAFGLALMQAGGTAEVMAQGDREAKAIYAAFPNRDGLTAALLARGGVEARSAAIEGGAGLLDLFFTEVDEPAGHDVADAAAQALGVQFKPWPTSANTHGFIEAAEELARRHVIAADDIVEVRVIARSQRLPWLEPLDERRYPGTAAAAANSIPYGIATALVTGRVGLQAFEPEALQDPAVVSVASKVIYEIDDDSAVDAIEVTTAGGAYSATVSALKGSVARPLEWSAIADKFMECLEWARPGSDPGWVKDLIACVDGLDRASDIGELTRLLRVEQ